MKSIQRLLIILMTTFGLLLILPYFIMQSAWGVKQLSLALSHLLPYQLTIGGLQHSLRTPYHIQLKDVIITDKHTLQPLLNAQGIHLELHRQARLSFTHFKKITLDNAVLLPSSELLLNRSPISANYLQLSNSKILWKKGQHHVIVEQVYGGMAPLSDQNTPPSSVTHFKLTAGKLTVNQFSLASLYLQGYKQNNQITVTQLGSDVQNGGLTASIQIKDHHWLIKELILNNLKLSSRQPVDLHSLFPKGKILPHIEIEQLNLTNSTIDTPNLKINQFNMQLTNSSLLHDQLVFGKGQLYIDADTLIYNDEQFENTRLSLNIKPERITVNDLTTHWQKGIIQTSGYLENKQLTLDKLMIAHINTSQTNIHHFMLPKMLKKIAIKKLMMSSSYVVNTTDTFPWQFIGLELRGENIILLPQKMLWITNGRLQFSSPSAALNGVPLSHFTGSLTVNNAQRTIQMSALTKQGIIELNTHITTPEIQLALNGYNIDYSTLNHLNLISSSLSETGDVSLLLKGECTLFPKLNGKLTLINNETHTVTHYQVQNAVLSTADIPETDIDNIPIPHNTDKIDPK